MMPRLNKLNKMKAVTAALVTAGFVMAAAPVYAQDYSSAWTRLLQKIVINGLVDYDVLLSKKQDLMTIKNLWLKQRPDPAASAQQHLAYWINGYNMLVLTVVVENWPLKRRWGLDALRYPSESIQQIPRVWQRPVVTTTNRSLSLNEIENDILRRRFNEPRIHFALVCASRGCPPLRNEAYEADRINEQLDHQVRAFLSDPNKTRYDPAEDVLYASPIFKWFAKDFDKAGGVRAFVRTHAPWPEAGAISETTDLRWLDYDWSLNRAP